MAAEFSANALQTVLPNASVIFTESPVPCRRGLIYHRDESGIIRLANNVPNSYSNGFGCYQRIFVTNYQVGFHANIAVPTGGTVGAIQLALAIDGEIDPSSIMIFTPAAVNTFGNVGAEIIVSVPSLCRCSSVSVRNVGTQAVDVQNANIVFNYAGIQRVQ